MISAKFIKSSFLYTISGTFPMVAGLALLPFYTNYLSKSNYGTLALYINFSVIIQTVAALSIDSALYLFHHKYKKDLQQVTSFYGAVNSLLFSVGMVVTLFFALAGMLIFPYLIDDTSANFYWFGIASVIGGFFSCYFRVYGHVLILHERPVAYFSINVVNLVLTIAISIAGILAYKDSVVGPMIGRVFSFLGVFLLCAFMFYRQYGLNFSWAEMKKILLASTPVFAYVLLMSLTVNVDIYILNHYVTKSEVGIYDLAVKCVVGIEFVINALWVASLPRVTQLLEEMTVKESNERMNRYFNVLSSLLILISNGTLLVIPVLIVMFIKKVEYYDAIAILPLAVLTFITAAMAHYFKVTIFYFQKNKRLIGVYTGIMAIKFAAGIPLASAYGIKGVMYSIYIAKLVEIVALYIASRDVFKYKFNVFKIIIMPVLFFVATLSIYSVVEQNKQYLYYFAELVFFSLLCAYVYRKELWLSAERYLVRK